jgi:chromosome segregation ATPase
VHEGEEEIMGAIEAYIAKVNEITERITTRKAAIEKELDGARKEYANLSSELSKLLKSRMAGQMFGDGNPATDTEITELKTKLTEIQEKIDTLTGMIPDLKPAGDEKKTLDEMYKAATDERFRLSCEVGKKYTEYLNEAADVRNKAEEQAAELERLSQEAYWQCHDMRERSQPEDFAAGKLKEVINSL